jgi:hypothetical protein
MAGPFASIVIDVSKLRDYCLSDRHPRGRHKARAFRARLGLTAADAESLRSFLYDAAQSSGSSLRPTRADSYGQRYELDLVMTTATGTAMMRSGWIVRSGEDVLRFTTCYVLLERP